MPKIGNAAGIALAIAAIVTLGACTGPQLETQAGRYQDAADAARDYAGEISDFLDDNPPGTIEDSMLAQGIRDLLPPDWTDRYDTLVATTGNVREAARLLADQRLPELADNLEGQAETLLDQAASEAEGWENFLSSAGAAVGALTGPGGILGLIGGTLAAIAGRDAQRRRREIREVSAHAENSLRERERERQARVQIENIAREAVALLDPQEARDRFGAQPKTEADIDRAVSGDES